jgi:hypothetical protein
MSRLLAAAAGALGMIVLASPAHATSYKFRVACPGVLRVVEWRTGFLDPGREGLRVWTGVRYPSCSISDFDPALDGALPVVILEGPRGILPFG